MTAAAFVDAVTAMKGLLPGMIEHLKAMAPKLTDSERDDALKSLKPLNADVVRLEKEEDAIFKKGAKEMASLKKKYMPGIKKFVEKRERSAAEASLDTNIQSL